MTDLAAWLTQIWDEQEESTQLTIEVTEQRHPASEFDVRWTWGRMVQDRSTRQLSTWFDPGVPSPSEVLARIAADRQTLDEVFVYEAVIDGEWGCCHGPKDIRLGKCPATTVNEISILRAMASAYADRPGYQEAWRPA